MGHKERFHRWVGYDREDEVRRLAVITSMSEEENAIRYADFIDDETIHFEPSRVAKFCGQFWDTFNKRPKTRRYVEKLDFNILIYSFLSYLIKTLDNSNVSNAYVSGMKEALNLNGQQRNLFNTVFNIGFILGSIPSQVMINNIRPSIWIPSCEIVWSILVMSMGAAKSAGHIYGVRFVLGMTESVAYPGFALVLGSWYGPEELAKRMTMYDAAWAIASMFSGYIQAGVYTSMNGLLGHAGWQWLFFIDGIIGLPISFLGYYSIPDFPINSRALWMSQVERDYSVYRMEKLGRKPPKKITIRRLIELFKTWRPYGVIWPWVLFSLCDTISYFNLYLKAVGKYTVQQINLIPTGGYALGLVVGYTCANLSDRTGYRGAYVIGSAFFMLLGNFLLAIWYIPTGLKFFAYYCPDIAYPLYGQMFTWIAETFQDDNELRGLLPAIGTTISSAIQAWLPLLIFPTTKAPHYPIGYAITSGFGILEIIGLVFFWYMANREKRILGVKTDKYGLPINVGGTVALVSPDDIEMDYGEKNVGVPEKVISEKVMNKEVSGDEQSL